MTTPFVIIGIIVLTLLLIGFVFFQQRKSKFSPRLQQEIQKKWNSILQIQDHNKAILEADKLLDFVLHKKKYQGSLGQKLKLSHQLYTSAQEVWYAHKLRNQIAHELDFHVSKDEYDRSIKAFRTALRDLDCDI